MYYRALAAIVLTVALAGCATVRTQQYRLDQTGVQGVTYFLPKRNVQFVGVRTPLTKVDVEKKIADAEKARDSAATAVGAAAAAKSAAELALQAPLISDERKRELQDDLAIATYQLDVATRTKTLKEAEIADLRSTLQQFNNGACVFSYSIKLETLAVTPDSSARFTANLSHSVLRDDVQKFTVTSDGLLNSANITATDRTGDILVELAGAIASFSGGGVSGQVQSLNQDGPAAGAPNCATVIKEFTYQFDPNDPQELAYTNPQGINARLAAAEWPFMISVSKPTDRAAPRAWLPNTCSPGTTCNSVDGLLYRTALPITVIVEQCSGLCNLAGANPIPVQAALVSLPQAGPISYIPMRSSAFVQTVDNVVFANGMLTSWEANRPSEVLEVVRLPVRILRSIVSVPAELFQLRVNYSNEASNLQDAYARQLQAQQSLVELQTCIREVETGVKESISDCVSD